MERYGYLEDQREGYPVAAWIWGHRLRLGQHWMEYLLEFLNVLAGFDYELGQGINSDGTSAKVEYTRFTRLGLRRFVFYDEWEKTRHPFDDAARKRLEAALRKLCDGNIKPDDDPLVLARSLLRAFSAVEESRSWFAKSLFPAHHNLLFWEGLRKGATKFKSSRSADGLPPHQLDADVAFDARNFFARGGEVYYLILSAGTRNAPERRQVIAERLRALLFERNAALVELPPAPAGRLPFLVGKTPAGRTVIADLADLPHLLVAGSTSSGKTIFLYSLLLSLIHNHGPKVLSLLLIDPKQTDFVYFEGLPHLLGGWVIIEAEAAIGWLDQLTTETLEASSQQLRAARCRDIHDYNARHPDAPLAPIVVVIDEYADLVQVLDKAGRQEFERRLVRLAQRARNVGIHLVIATQRPSADIVTTSLKTNLPARVAFRLPAHHDSMTILDQAGAENLLGRGDMLFALSQGNVERLQGFYIDPDELSEYLTTPTSNPQTAGSAAPPRH